MALIIYIVLGIVAFVVGLLVYSNHTQKKQKERFKKYGVPFLDGEAAAGFRLFTGKSNIIQFSEEMYKLAKEAQAPIVAKSDGLIITDLDILKRMLVKDFDHFVNLRQVKAQESNKYFTKMLFAMRDEQWKASRSKMTPAFTTGKIRQMFQIFQTSSERMDKYIKEQINYPKVKTAEIDFAKLLLKYSMDVIASCAFGIDSQGWSTSIDQQSTFEKFGKLFSFKLGPKDMFKMMIIVFLPKLADWLNLSIFNYEAQSYFETVIKDVLKRRRQSGERRNDFLQLMIDIQQGTLKAENDDESENPQKSLSSSAKQQNMVFNDEYLISNALMFFLGGLDPQQTVLIFTMYSLALEPEVQEKLYEEVKSAMDKHGGKLTYEAITEMTYMDMVINEVLRLYPAAAIAERECTTDYVVEENGLKIDKGTIVQIPIRGIHMDPKYYQDPDKFIPERFTQENKALRHQFAFLPFGHGPRSCIGMRFALIKIKTGIAQLVSSYKLTPSAKTLVPMQFDSSASAKPANGMWLNVTAREE